jgi:CRISPR/Cas system-associated exonuclease Cas4 (RecB family)
MKTIRASEISSYLYCKRAWYYQRQGVESENQVELATGTRLHARHGRNVMVNSCLQAAAYILLLGAVVLFTLTLIQGFLR